MRYTIRFYGDIKHLVYKHSDGTELLSTSLNGLIDTIKAYNSIYYGGARV